MPPPTAFSSPLPVPVPRHHHPLPFPFVPALAHSHRSLPFITRAGDLQMGTLLFDGAFHRLHLPSQFSHHPFFRLSLPLRNIFVRFHSMRCFWLTIYSAASSSANKHRHHHQRTHTRPILTTKAHFLSPVTLLSRSSPAFTMQPWRYITPTYNPASNCKTGLPLSRKKCHRCSTFVDRLSAHSRCVCAPKPSNFKTSNPSKGVSQWRPQKRRSSMI